MQAVGLAGIGSQLIGSAAGTVGNVISSDVSAKALDAQARSIDENTAFDERQFRRDAKIKAGSNIAIAAASGVDITRGNPLFDELQYAKQVEIEAQSIRRSGEMAAANAKFQSRLTRQQIPFQIAQGVTSIFGDRKPGTSILNMLAGVK